ncbi:hypothetical protein L204_106275 [Cryptococcus depauperatus]|nr:charged multivesicular body protein 7 [Cryptococcus depauperatus CBS 7855]
MQSQQLPPFLKVKPPPAPPPSKARLQALYASTSAQRTTNLTGYNANSQWWASILEETLRTGWLNGEDGDRLIMRVDEALLGRLVDEKGLRPRGIGGVMERLATATPSAIHTLASFMTSSTPLYLPPTLASRFIGRPLWWAFSQLNPFGGGDNAEREETLWTRYGKGKEYVHMILLEQSTAAFSAYMLKNPVLSYTGSLYDLESFLTEYGQVCFPKGTTKKQLPEGKHQLSKRDVEVLVKWMSRDCGLIVTDGTVIKILEVGQTVADHPITDADRGSVSVSKALLKIKLQIEDIERQITESQQKAKKYLTSNQKSVALSYLRSKKQLEELLSKRVASSEQLRAVISSIDQAKGDAEIMAAYEISAATLSKVLAHPALSPDSIASTTDALAEAMANQEEIDQAVRVGREVAMGSRRMDVDEDELAKELEDLVKEEKEKREEAKLSAEREKVDSKAKTENLQTDQVQSSTPTFSDTLSVTAGNSVDQLESEESVWRKRHEEAQARKQAEKERFQIEQLKKDEGRIAAE